MVDNKISFYLQNNNNLFNSDVLVVCYKDDEDEVKEYGLISTNIVLFIKSDEISEIKTGCDCNYYEEIKKYLKIKK